jgi:restriction system protein
MKNYYRVMCGKKSVYAEQCFAGNFIGTDFDIAEDLTYKLPDQWREFNRQFIPIWLSAHPGKSKIAAGLSCGFTWTVAKGIAKGDRVLCPNGTGAYRVGEIVGDYQYAPGQALPHRRPVQWLSESISRAAMTDPLKYSAGSIGTVSNLSVYRDEIEKLLAGDSTEVIVSADPTIEDAAAFAMESHLEDFLVENWEQTDFGKDFAIFEEDEEKVGKQYTTDAGRIDILAVSKDKKRLLVIELKKGRTSDVVVGQLLRYMGYVKEELAEPDQSVSGVIIALKEDQKLRWAIAPVPTIALYLYQINFKLRKV